MIIVFRGLVNIIEEDFPRMYSFSWRKKPNYSIVIEISQDAVELMAKIKKNAPVLIYHFEEFQFKEFADDINGKMYGFENCASINRFKDGSIELVFELKTIKDKESEQYLYACSATMNVIFILLDSIPEKEINDPFPQFIKIGTACCKNKPSGHGGNIGGELNKDVKRYLSYHYLKKGKNLKNAFSALTAAASILNGKKVNLGNYWAEVRSETGFLSIECPGNSCGLNTDNPEKYRSLLGKREEKDFGMDLICHNVDTLFQQTVLIAALAALSDEVKKHYIRRRKCLVTS